jgi:hypothetical protein
MDGAHFGFVCELLDWLHGYLLRYGKQKDLPPSYLSPNSLTGYSTEHFGADRLLRNLHYDFKRPTPKRNEGNEKPVHKDFILSFC